MALTRFQARLYKRASEQERKRNEKRRLAKRPACPGAPVPFSQMCELNGETKPLAEWARVAGLSFNGLKYRLQSGIPLEQALILPKGKQAVMVSRSCDTCGANFVRPKRNRVQRFCSKECRHRESGENEHRVLGPIAEIILDRGEIAIIDSADLPLVLKFKWRVFLGRNGKKYASANDKGSIVGRPILLHRFLMGVVDAGKEVQVDHQDGNGLNCRRGNMRVCNAQQNSCNRVQPRTKAPYRGLRWHAKKRKWGASVKSNGTYFYLGWHDDPIVAARAYDAKARELFGEFATVNFPEEVENHAQCN